MEHRKTTKRDYGLNDGQYDELCNLMDMKMCDWPHGLWEHVNERAREIGFCGEVVVCAVADWVKLSVAP